MTDELSVPQVPEATQDDPEDVSWALSTAEAMWARGDHLEGIKWVRRAAEAASEADNDGRALVLAKAAAELTGLITRMTSHSVDLEELEAELELSSVKPPPPPPSVKPMIPVAKPQPASVTKQVATPSRPPAPLPSSRSSQPPPMKGKPLGTNSGKAASVRPPPGKPKADSKEPGKERESRRPPRKSRENLDAAARQALAAPRRPDFGPTNAVPAAAAAIEKEVAPNRVAQRDVGNNDPTVIGLVDELTRAKEGSVVEEPSADAWDASPTQDLTGDDVPIGLSPFRAANRADGDRATAVGVSREELRAALARRRAGGSSVPAAAPASSSRPPATVAAPGQIHSPLIPPASPSSPAPGRAPATEPHDPALLTSQAVRVVVWRDASGVHVAPAGTVVSAITVEAVLVALEPNADLTAWLSQRSR
jgi:hypothetical protein